MELSMASISNGAHSLPTTTTFMTMRLVCIRFTQRPASSIIGFMITRPAWKAREHLAARIGPRPTTSQATTSMATTSMATTSGFGPTPGIRSPLTGSTTTWSAFSPTALWRSTTTFYMTTAGRGCWSIMSTMCPSAITPSIHRPATAFESTTLRPTYR